MTAHSIYRLACDAPHCPTTGIIETILAEPPGWRRISSDDHLADWRPEQQIRLSNGRRRTDQRSRWDVVAGAFVLHLCPNHPTAFGAHLPRTEGAAADRRTGDRRVSVWCSCGDLRASARDLTIVGREPMPNRLPERTWWQHLPEGLREYATRGRMEVAA